MATVWAGSARPDSPYPTTLFVPGGRFSMGFEEGAGDERPVHAAEVRPVRIGRAPVTNAEYALFLACGRAPEPPWWRDPDFRNPDQPVVGITWFEAVAYCAWLCETLGGRWRLPTEAEWEHAMRSVPAASGAKPHRRRSPGPAPVGRGVSTGDGLLAGDNGVREWCQDWYASDAYFCARRYDPRGPEVGDLRVQRGRSWRVAEPSSPFPREGLAPSARRIDTGFRVVREVP